MPPVAKAGGSNFRKSVDFVAKDDDEQVAAGIVMVPDKADLQNDFVREGTIRQFADQFEAFVDADQAGGGIMHAVFPDEWMTLERNEVLDEATEIGGTQAPAGAWIQEWRIQNADLWTLIQDSVIAGYSIGAIQVDWNGPFDQDEDDVDDVEVPDDLGDGAMVWELTDGIIREVSAVDIPAVPDAQILETKADTEKRLGDYLGDPNGFIEEAQGRGHSEEEAQRLWDILNAAVEVEGSSEPGKQTVFHRAGKAFIDALTGGDGSKVSEASADSPRDRDKEGRTLSSANRDSLMASIDANLDVLEDAGVDHGMTRFTDRDDVGFDLSDHSASEWSSGNDVENGVPSTENAAGSETPDADDTKSMTDDPFDDAPEWAKAIREGQEKNSSRIDDLSDKVADPDDPEKAWDDAPEWAKALREEQEKNRDQIDLLAEASGKSQQLKGGNGNGSGEGRSKADVLGIPGGDN